jgi:hypothetical protein
MNENRENLAASIQGHTQDLADLMSAELVTALSEAAEDDELWFEAARDVEGFLKGKDVALPGWAVIRLEAVEPAARVMKLRDLPECRPGEMRVARRGRTYCARPIYVCRRLPHIGEVCIFSYCMKWETDWLDARCVPTRDLLARQGSPLRDFSLPQEYGGGP